MSDLLARMKSGTKAFKLIGTPWDPTVQVAVRILSQAQYQDAVVETEEHFKARKIELTSTTAVEWENERALRLLYKALQDPKDNFSPIAPDILTFRNLMSPPEVQYFLDEMLAWQSECSPSIEKLSADEADRLIEDLKKKPEETGGRITNLQTARKLLLIMANLLKTSRKGNG